MSFSGFIRDFRMQSSEGFRVWCLVILGGAPHPVIVTIRDKLSRIMITIPGSS